MKVQEEINAEKAHLDKAQEDVLQESQCFEDEGIHLGFHREELSMIQQRRYRSRLPVRMDRSLSSGPSVAIGFGERTSGGCCCFVLPHRHNKRGRGDGTARSTASAQRPPLKHCQRRRAQS